MKKGFTLTDLIVVIIIIGILAVLAFPNFSKTKESTVDKEAQANLKLMSAAEKIYHMENNFYVISADRAEINSNLKLALPVQNWNYKIVSDADFTAKAQRVNDAANAWCMRRADENPYKTGCSW